MRFRHWLWCEGVIGLRESGPATATPPTLGPAFNRQGGSTNPALKGKIAGGAPAQAANPAAGRPAEQPLDSNQQAHAQRGPSPAAKAAGQTEYQHPDEMFEDAIAEYTYHLVETAIKQYYANNRKKRFGEIMGSLGGHIGYHQIGEEENTLLLRDKNARLIPEKGPVTVIRINVPPVITAPFFKNLQLPPKFQNIEIRIKPINGNAGASKRGNVINVGLNTGPLQNAVSYDDKTVQSMLTRIRYQLHHESSHLSSASVSKEATRNHNAYTGGRATHGTDEYNQGMIAYFLDKGELRAHAKQFAVLYHRYFPDQPFTMKNMTVLLPHGGNSERYLMGLSAGGKGKELWGFDTAPYATKFIEAQKYLLGTINHFLSQFKQWRQTAQ